MLMKIRIPLNLNRGVLLKSRNLSTVPEPQRLSEAWKQQPRKLAFPQDLANTSPEINRIVGLHTANNSQRISHHIQSSLLKVQRHNLDTGSSEAQIAAMTEKIRNMTRHFLENKHDKAKKRYFEILINRRRKLMQYLMRKDVTAFGRVAEQMGIQREASQVRGISGSSKRN